MLISAVNDFFSENDNNFPMCVMFFNGSRFQIRNYFLGFSIVDDDISEFDSLLAGCSVKSKRVGGNEWLSKFGMEYLLKIKQLLHNYEKWNELDVLWDARPASGHLFKDKQFVLKSGIHRTIDCYWAKITSMKEMGAFAGGLLSGKFWEFKEKVFVYEEVKINAVKSEVPLVKPLDFPKCAFCEKILCESFCACVSYAEVHVTCNTCGCEMIMSASPL